MADRSGCEKESLESFTLLNVTINLLYVILLYASWGIEIFQKVDALFHPIKKYLPVQKNGCPGKDSLVLF